MFFFFTQKTAYEMRISDWSSDVCSSDLGDQQTGNRCCVLQRGANDLGRIDHAGFHQILVNFGLSIEAEVGVGLFDQLAGNHSAVMTGILRDLTKWSLQRLANDVDAAGLVFVDALHAFERSEEHTSELQSLMRISYAV